MKRLVLLVLPVLAIGCAEETTSSDRKSTPSSSGSDAGTDATTEAATADPNDGRDSDPASCYAVCSNTSFTCGSSPALVANLAPDEKGCTGTIGPAGGATKPLKLDCGPREVCVDGACVGGSFSAFTFSYTPAGGAKIVCTRD